MGMINESEAVVRVWGRHGNCDGHFDSPTGIAIGMNAIYVTDSKNHRIQCFHSDGTFISKWGRYGYADGEFNEPAGIAISTCEGMRASVMAAVVAVPELDAFPPGILPICVTYIGEERIYVVERRNHRIQVFQYDGKFSGKWGSEGGGNGQFRNPYGCAIAADGMVYVSDTWNHRIQIFDDRGNFLCKWGKRGKGDGELKYPVGIAIGGSGVVYVSETGGRRVQCFRSNGTYIERLTQNTHCANPYGIMVDNDHRFVYVSSTASNRLYQYRIDGTLVRVWNRSNWYGPCGIAKGTDGLLYIVDKRNRIVVMNVTLSKHI